MSTSSNAQEDASTFTVVKKKAGVPMEVLKAIGINGRSEIANPSARYNSGCIRDHRYPNYRMNWAARSSSGTWFLSMSYGGRANVTRIHKVTLVNGTTTLETYVGYDTRPSNDLQDVLRMLDTGVLRIDEHFEP